MGEHGRRIALYIHRRWPVVRQTGWAPLSPPGRAGADMARVRDNQLVQTMTTTLWPPGRRGATDDDREGGHDNNNRARAHPHTHTRTHVRT